MAPLSRVLLLTLLTYSPSDHIIYFSTIRETNNAPDVKSLQHQYKYWFRLFPFRSPLIRECVFYEVKHIFLFSSGY